MTPVFVLSGFAYGASMIVFGPVRPQQTMFVVSTAGWLLCVLVVVGTWLRRR